MSLPTTTTTRSWSELPLELWGLIARAAVVTTPVPDRGERHFLGTSTAWQCGHTEHPLVALSQTSQALRALAIPLLWTNVTLSDPTWYRTVDLVRKLITCLQVPSVRDMIRSLNLDLNPGTLMNPISGSWHIMPEFFRGPRCAPDLSSALRLMTDLGQALAGTGLVQLRFLALGVHPSKGLVEHLASIASLKHVELAYGSIAAPESVFDNELFYEGPEPLDLLSQVERVTIGLGCGRWTRLARDENDWVMDDEMTGLVGWLCGLSSSRPASEAGNHLRYLKTSAAFLYHHRCLIPAWARLKNIFDQAEHKEDDENSPLASFALGEERSVVDSVRHVHDLTFVRAAKALRPALDRLAIEHNDLDGGMRAEHIVTMIRADPVFAPWCAASNLVLDVEDAKSWFHHDNETESLRLAEDILSAWRGSPTTRPDNSEPPARWLTGWQEVVA
ncbi:hypothetical protein V8E36_000941 [Tilletia maclaganii]